MKKLAVFILASISSLDLLSQGFNQKTFVVGANIGVPHLYRGILKITTNSNLFKNQFNGKLEISNISGIYPITYRAEYGINKYFGLGISGGIFSLNFQVKDFYNVLRAGQITGTDEIDTYKFKITSASIGIRPNLHIPLKNPDYDFYLGFGIGYTSNRLNINFSSTDVSKILSNFNYSFSLPGGMYFAPTIGLRRYYGKYFGLNFELGYDKGAILMGGINLRFNHKVSQEKDEKKS
jgi:hypothetical protein